MCEKYSKYIDNENIGTLFPEVQLIEIFPRCLGILSGWKYILIFVSIIFDKM